MTDSQFSDICLCILMIAWYINDGRPEDIYSKFYCSNAFEEGVFSHMKHAWINSRNLMCSETVATELKIWLNSQVKCKEFFGFIQNEPELIKCARRVEKYTFKKKQHSGWANV